VSCVDKPNRCRIRPDGSAITIGGSRPDKVDPSGLLVRSVVVKHPHGGFIAVVNTNTTSPNAKRPTRPQPGFTAAQLTVLADSKLWRFPPKTAG
jgi:hypothetical protein